MQEVNIYPIITNKKQYLELLLLADEQESMIDRYLERGDMFILEDNGVKAVCVVTDEGNGTCELKNIAVSPDSQRRGYGKKLINYLIHHYSHKYAQMIVGTGDVPSAIGFYQSCGFEYSHRIENFFIDNYDHLIVEEGVLLKDMVYLKQNTTKNFIIRAAQQSDVIELFYCKEKGIKHCYQCDTFPCNKFKSFAKRWLKYGQDFIENQEQLKQVGEIEFLKRHNQQTS